jgi:carbonic anhydrase/acetyltransferase-like protein (isoleucine patch superfamily)
MASIRCGEERDMPIFELAGERPEFPADGQYWIAETAVVIGRGCVIGHNVVLHGCAVGDGSLIGMGAILLNGARIGTNSIVGAGAVVTEGKTFPDNSLVVGAPARVIRSLDEKAAEMIAHGANVYVRRWKYYAGALKRIE